MKRVLVAVALMFGLVFPVVVAPQVASATTGTAYYGPDNQSFMTEFDCYNRYDVDDSLHGYSYCSKSGALNGVNVYHKVRIQCDYPSPIPSDPRWYYGAWVLGVGSSHKWCGFPRQKLVVVQTRHKVVYY